MPLYRYNGALLVRSGALAVSADCCCTACDCPLYAAAAEGQKVSFTSSCPCKEGSLAGCIELGRIDDDGCLVSYSGGETTGCVYSESGSGVKAYSYATVTVLCCQCEDGSYSCLKVRFQAYVYSDDCEGVTGESTGGSLTAESECGSPVTIDENGCIVGTITLTGEWWAPCASEFRFCDITLTFGCAAC